MVESNEAKGMANKSGCTAEWQIYCKLRNHVTKQKEEETVLLNT
jgi:hypothetical protein